MAGGHGIESSWGWTNLGSEETHPFFKTEVQEERVGANGMNM